MHLVLQAARQHAAAARAHQAGAAVIAEQWYVGCRLNGLSNCTAMLNTLPSACRGERLRATSAEQRYMLLRLQRGALLSYATAVAVSRMVLILIRAILLFALFACLCSVVGCCTAHEPEPNDVFRTGEHVFRIVKMFRCSLFVAVKFVSGQGSCVGEGNRMGISSQRYYR